MKPHRNPHEDERLGLSRRSFFFFGAIHNVLNSSGVGR